MRYSPKYKVDDIVDCKDWEGNVVISGVVATIHSFEDKPAIYIVTQIGTNDTYPFTESKIDIAKMA
tara:strand:+ start:198 stop:395 length:198 start_codon:yes stop_codon:yes gene_type:complete